MLMKYKDFKMLSADDMKKIRGGNAPEDEGDALCSSYCTKEVGNTTYIKKCRTSVAGCVCTQSGGSSCKD